MGVSPLVILGLDPGTRVVGFGVLRVEGTRMALLEAGVLRPPAGDPLERRLAGIAGRLREVLERHRPQEAAIEDVFVKADPRAALAIGHGRGALLAVLGEARIPIASYPPATVKRAVTGQGRAEKAQVARMVAGILGLTRLPQPLDATDAVAVALCHALRGSSQDLVSKALASE